MIIFDYNYKLKGECKMEIEYGYDYSEEIKKLFLEYTDVLVENDSNFAEYLEVQSYDSELQHLDYKYGLPYGRLYIAKVDNLKLRFYDIKLFPCFWEKLF